LNEGRITGKRRTAMQDLWALVRFGHLLAAVFMAAPLYALLAVNERGRFGAGLAHDLDHYMEGMIRQQPFRCLGYLAMLLVTGLLLLSGVLGGLGVLVVNRTVAVHVLFFVLLVGFLSYVHFSLQPRVDDLLAQVPKAGPAPDVVGPAVWALRRRRKKIATACLFLVIGTVLLGLRVMAPFGVPLTVALLVLAALFSWRVYRSLLPYGWF
jgi:hypothetical protein